jgi:hypothetical protein
MPIPARLRLSDAFFVSALDPRSAKYSSVRSADTFLPTPLQSLPPLVITERIW